MNTFYKGLFEYNNHINQQLIELFLEHQEKVSEKSVKLFNHIFNSHQVWNGRIEQTKNTVTPWDIRPTASFKEIETANFATSLRILDTSDLNTIIHYQNFKGESFSNTIGDILFHVINHSTYHRGQIASDIKQSGLQPIVSDYIHYKRQ